MAESPWESAPRFEISRAIPPSDATVTAALAAGPPRCVDTDVARFFPPTSIGYSIRKTTSRTEMPTQVTVGLLPAMSRVCGPSAGARRADRPETDDHVAAPRVGWTLRQGDAGPTGTGADGSRPRGLGDYAAVVRSAVDHTM